MFMVARADGVVELVAPYCVAYVMELKATVPSAYRQFNADKKSWRIWPPYVNAAFLCARRWFDAVEVLVPEHLPIAKPTTTLVDDLRRRFPDHATLHLLPDAPDFVIHAAYRALAREHHPDRAGAQSHQAMVELNRAYARLRPRSARSGRPF